MSVLIFILFVLILVCMTKIFQNEGISAKNPPCSWPPCKQYGDVCSDSDQCSGRMRCIKYTGWLVSDHTARCQ